MKDMLQYALEEIGEKCVEEILKWHKLLVNSSDFQPKVFQTY